MKISLISMDFYPNIGGVAQHVYELTKALDHKGHEVEVLTVDNRSDWASINKPMFRDESMDVPVYRVPFVINRSIRFFTGKISYALSERSFHRLLLNHLAESPPDIAHWHAISSQKDMISAWKGSPSIWTNHTSHFIAALKVPSRRKRFERWAEVVDRIIAPSAELAELSQQLEIEPDHVHSISNGIDVDRFAPTVSAQIWIDRLNLRPEEKLILCPRRLDRKNGVIYFVRAALRLLEQGNAHLRFAIAGSFDGQRSVDGTKEIEDLVRGSEHGDRIELLGKVENRDMPSLYAASTVVVIPSLVEATSISCLEAMATGKPIVASRVGGLPELIEHEKTGVLVEAEDDCAIAEWIGRLTRDSEEAGRLGEAARNRAVTHFSWARIADLTLEVYEKALGRAT